MKEKLLSQLRLMHLPDELLLKILAYLDFRQISRASRICKHFYVLVQDNQFPVKALVVAYQKLPHQIRSIQQTLRTLQTDNTEYLRQDEDVFCNANMVMFPSFLLLATLTLVMGLNVLPKSTQMAVNNFYDEEPIQYFLLVGTAYLVNIVLASLSSRYIVRKTYPRFSGVYVQLFGKKDDCFKQLVDLKNQYKLILEAYQPFVRNLPGSEMIDSNFVFRILEKPGEINHVLQFLQAAKELTPFIIQHIYQKAILVSKVAQQQKARNKNSPAFFKDISVPRTQKNIVHRLEKRLGLLFQSNRTEKKDIITAGIKNIAQTYFKRLYHA